MIENFNLCDLCGGKLSPGNTSLEIWCGEELILLKDVPADVCQQCGEAYFSAEISERLDSFIERYGQYKPLRHITVPEFSGAQLFPPSL